MGTLLVWLMKKSCIPTLLKKPYLFRRITTLSYDEFETLTKKLKQEWEEREETRLNNKTRINKIGQGRPYALGDFSNLLFCALLYLRTTMGYELLGLLCGIDQTTVKRVVRRMLPLLQDRFMPDTAINRGKRRTNKLDDLIREYPELAEVLFDGSDMPIKRPTRRQKYSYSGKKKRHTKKVQIALNKKDKLILGVSLPKRGRISDKKQLEKTRWDNKLSVHVVRSADLGYLGMKGWRIPHKRPKGGSLTKSQKRWNRQFSKERIFVEHGIRGMKTFRRIGEVITAKTDAFLFTTLLATANLYNFKRLMRQGLG